MKKVLLTIGMIAILVGIALITLAPAPPSTVNLSTLNAKLDTLTASVAAIDDKVDALTGNVSAIGDDVSDIMDDLGNVTRMETLSVSYVAEQNYQVVKAYEVQYEGTRHVSLTLQWDGMETYMYQWIAVLTYTADSPAWPEAVFFVGGPGDFPESGIQTVEFNTDHWYINIFNEEPSSFPVYYAATVTYPFQP